MRIYILTHMYVYDIHVNYEICAIITKIRYVFLQHRLFLFRINTGQMQAIETAKVRRPVPVRLGIQLYIVN